MCYLYFFCLHCCLINIHIFDYPDSRLSRLFTEVPTSPDNQGSTVIHEEKTKELPWTRFGYAILVVIKFSELLLWISLRIINVLRSCIKHSKECFISYPNTLNLVKKSLAVPHFFNPLLSVWISVKKLFLVFDIWFTFIVIIIYKSAW